MEGEPVHRKYLKYPRRIAVVRNEFKTTTLRMQRTASSIGFIEKCLKKGVVPTFAKVKGQFINENERKLTEFNLMRSHLSQHRKNLKKLSLEFDNTKERLTAIVGKALTNLLHKAFVEEIRKENTRQFRTKNGKLTRLAGQVPRTIDDFTVPIINLSSFEDLDTSVLRYGMNYSFVNKNRFIKRDIAVELENLATILDKEVPSENKETFHEFLRSYTNRFAHNIYQTRDSTFKNLHALRTNREIVILSGDKDSCVVILNREDYVRKVDDLLEEGISDGVYELTEDKTHEDLENFRSFVSRNFKQCDFYKDIWTSKNQPGRLFCTAKTHKFDDLSLITVENLKLRPIIDQSNSYTSNTAVFLAKYLRPLQDKEYLLDDTLKFPDLLRKLPPKGLDEEDVSYDVEALFTSVPIDYTIDYIINEIYEKELLKPLCKKLIFRRLLKRMCSGCVFSANGKLVRQKDGCPIGGKFSMVMASICMTKCIREIIIPMNPPFFKLYVDDGFCRRKKGDHDHVLEALNGFHPRLKFTDEVEPDHFLDSKICKNEDARTFSLKVFHKPNKFPIHWSSQTPRRYKRNAIFCELHRASVISDDFDGETANIRERYLHAGYPVGFVNETIKNFKFERFQRIVPQNLFEVEDSRPILRVRLPFCKENENLWRMFLKKLKSFAGDLNVFVIWDTCRIRTLFPLKDKNLHPCCVIYEGTCTCGEKYIGETERCIHARTSEHEDIKKKSEPAKHLANNVGHSFTWKILARAPSNRSKRLILEANYISKFKPRLNEQLDFRRKLRLFPNGIT